MSRSFSSCVSTGLLTLSIVSFVPGQTVTAASAAQFSAPECLHQAIGTASPPNSGAPQVANASTGSVVAANFFGSGAISDPDGRFVRVCLTSPDVSGHRQMIIDMDVGMDNNFQIKAYPEIIVGSKFGLQSESSFRFYNRTDLPPEHQWPVTADEGTEFANLEYVADVKGVSLPAFTIDLPPVTVRLDMDEYNVVGAERDVMLESWFHDTSANAGVLGPLVGNTLNNIVGVGHPGFADYENTLLEMMVHIGALSPNDVSQARNNPSKYRLTVALSGEDLDADGIDDVLDIDNYPEGIDLDLDGIEDSRFPDPQIGSFTYSVWHGGTFLAPLVVYSRETNILGNREMNLSGEGEIELNWNAFLDFSLGPLETMMMANQVSWVVDETLNPFPIMRSPAGAVSGVEFGVELQTNAAPDLPYRAVVNKYEVLVGGIRDEDDVHIGARHFGLGIVNPDEDDDLDGYSNLVEFFAGSDSNDASSLPDTFKLPNAEWRLVALPLQPPVHANTVEAIFADDIDGAYGISWVLFSFDADTGDYVQLQLDDTLQAGDSFWIVQGSGYTVKIDMPAGSTAVQMESSVACSASTGCYPVGLASSASGTAWNLLGNPFYTQPSLEKLRVTTAAQPCTTEGCSLSEAAAADVLYNSLFGFDGQQYQLVTAGDRLSSWASYWIPALPAAGDDGVQVLMRRD